MAQQRNGGSRNSKASSGSQGGKGSKTSARPNRPTRAASPVRPSRPRTERTGGDAGVERSLPRVRGDRYNALHPALVAEVEQVVGAVLAFTAPADMVVSRHFRANPRLGHRDRGVIAEAVYAVLRRKLEFAQFAQSGAGSLNRRFALLGLAFTAGVEPLTAALGVRETDWLRALLKIDRASLAFETRCNLPSWLLAALRERLGDEEIWQLAEALNQSAPLDLRVNALKSSRDAALAALQEAGVAGAAGSMAPWCIRLAGKPALQHLALFNDGTIEVQDEGSQLLAQLVAPRRGELVVDFCAGAGGKTLALGALMKNTGRLYAMDVSATRLARLKPRLSKSGLSNVHPVALDSERDPRLKRMVGKADRVLVDAPCSGLGTLRRNPDLKWRQTPATVAEMNAKQTAILAAAARLVKPGGRLVYATCSLLRAENAAIVDDFLASHPEFVRSDAKAVLAAQQIAVETGADLELCPHRHGNDGFYAAVLERRRGAGEGAKQQAEEASPQPADEVQPASTDDPPDLSGDS